ncbi:hypothetical protein [Endozoicomonas atrinae]|uniref:hypothetical protein n=1 Tax=Endozoicomonas atrinae TaxID=1333660 RepID=UPI003B004E47
MTEPLKLPENRRSFYYLARLYESNDNRVLRACLTIDWPNEAADIITSGALTPGGLTYEIPIDTDDGPQWLDVVERESGVFTCYCASEGFVEVSEEQQRQYIYDQDWLIKVLKSHLNLTGEQVSLIPGTLEWLGNLQVDGRPYQILLAKYLTSMDGFKTIYQFLENWHGKTAGVVLTISERLNHLLPLPDGYPVMSIMSLLSSQEPCNLDAKKLKELLKASYKPSSGTLEVRWESHGSNGQFESEGLDPWEVRGGQRCKVASMIYDAWLVGNRGVSTEEIREEGISYTHPRNCFNDSNRWEDYIKYDSKVWSLKATPRSRRHTVT